MMDTEQDKVKAAMAAHAKVVVGDEKKKQNMCMTEVKVILAKYNCDLVPTVILRPGKMEFFVETKVLGPPPDQRKRGEHAAHQKGKKDQARDEENLRQEERPISILRLAEEEDDQGNTQET